MEQRIQMNKGFFPYAVVLGSATFLALLFFALYFCSKISFEGRVLPGIICFLLISPIFFILYRLICVPLFIEDGVLHFKHFAFRRTLHIDEIRCIWTAPLFPWINGRRQVFVMKRKFFPFNNFAFLSNDTNDLDGHLKRLMEDNHQITQ